jgi:hypothetical protein
MNVYNENINLHIFDNQPYSIDNEDNLVHLINNLNQDIINTENKIINYYDKFINLKEIRLICDYYGISKFIKTNKLNKLQIIDFLINFEQDITNVEIVDKRKKMWFYINEIKKDKFIKKFILL